jgi:hypothetical protein
MPIYDILREFVRSSPLRWIAVTFLSLGITQISFGLEAEHDGADIIEKYVTSTQLQQQAMRGMTMEVEIDADLPKLHKSGKMSARRVISKLGQISYKVLGFSGDDDVKKDVIARYLQAETESQKDNTQFAINQTNYKFRYKGSLQINDQRDYLFDLKPRRKRVGLFRGELWLDAKTYMPLRETGRFVKTPSVFLKKVEFVRSYEIRDGIAIPKRIDSKIDTRLAGLAEIHIDYTNVKQTDVLEKTEDEARLAQ